MAPAPSQPTATPVATQTRTSTRTKVAAMGIGLLALGLGAYGFGFLPGIDFGPKEKMKLSQIVEEQQQPETVVEPTILERCQQACQQQEERCTSPVDADVKKCYITSGQCRQQCGQDFPVVGNEDMPAPSENKPDLSGPTPPSPTCTLTAEIMPDFRPLSTLAPGGDTIIPGAEVWQPLAEYRLSATGDDVTIRRVGVKTSYDAASFEEVAVVHGSGASIIVGRGRLSSGSPARADIGLTTYPTILAGSSTEIQLWGRLAPVIPRSTTAVSSGVARSGSLVNLGFTSGPPDYASWDASYNGKYHLEAECATSRTPVFANANPPAGGREFVVRKSVLRLNQLPLPSTTLTNGTQDIYRFQASAGAAGQVSFKKIEWIYSRSTALRESSIGNFRLMRNGRELPRADYRIIDSRGVDLYDQILSPSTAEAVIILMLTNEELISGSGNSYALRATVRNPSTGDTFTLNPTMFGTEPDRAGYLAADGGIGGLNLDLSEPADGNSEYGGALLWSDLSEVPHSDALGTAGGSRDWIAKLLEFNLRRQTLSR